MIDMSDYVIDILTTDDITFITNECNGIRGEALKLKLRKYFIDNKERLGNLGIDFSRFAHDVWVWMETKNEQNQGYCY